MSMPDSAVDESKASRAVRKKGVLAVLVVIAAFFFARFHAIVGGDLSFPMIVMKDSLGFSETVVDVDKITGMPFIFALAQYPIGTKVLQREGVIETQEEFEARHKREFEEEFGSLEREVANLSDAADMAANDALSAAAEAAAAAEALAGMAGVDDQSAVSTGESDEAQRQAAIDAYTQELQLLQDFDKAVRAANTATIPAVSIDALPEDVRADLLQQHSGDELKSFRGIALNVSDDARKDYMVYGGSGYCGSGGCRADFYVTANDAWRIIGGQLQAVYTLSTGATSERRYVVATHGSVCGGTGVDVCYGDLLFRAGDVSFGKFNIGTPPDGASVVWSAE